MSSLKEIKRPIAAEMSEFETWFRKSMKTSVPLLDKITHYIIKRKGKQMRPMVVFLSSKMFGPTKEATYIAASLIELLHTATLVHDDVVDNANVRRNFFSINALWKNKIAVLVGDYLLSQGLLLSVKHKQYRLLDIVSNAVKKMSEGELLQIEKTRKLDIKEDIYFDIIRQKTASLMAACSACGAASAGCDDETIEKMRQFGEYTGIAFQIKDDLFDYGSDKNIGKPTGIDIKEKKLTLPLIYALNHANYSKKLQIKRGIKKSQKHPQKLQEVIQFVIDSGGIEYTREKMYAYREKALNILNDFPDTEAKSSLKELLVFVTERKL